MLASATEKSKPGRWAGCAGGGRDVRFETKWAGSPQGHDRPADLETASTALSTPQCPVTKAFSRLPGFQHSAPHLFFISGVLSAALLAWETGEGDCCEHCPHPPAPQSIFMENPCYTNSEGSEGPLKGNCPLLKAPGVVSRALHQSGSL